MRAITHAFTARIHKLDINPCVDVPAKVVAALLGAAGKKAGPIPVSCRIDTTEFAATVVKYRGEWRLYLNTQTRKRAGLDMGDCASLELAYDPAPRMPPMPDEFRIALANDETAKQRWRLQPSAKRRAILEALKAKGNGVRLAAAIVDAVSALTKETR